MESLKEYIKLLDDLEDKKDELHTVEAKLDWYDKNYDFIAEYTNDINRVDSTMADLRKKSFALRKDIALMEYLVVDYEENDYNRDQSYTVFMIWDETLLDRK